MKLSIVILNYNSGTMLRDCLDSLFEDDLPTPYEVIVPDNASSDDSIALALEKWGDRIVVLHNGDNRGFSWGNNKGIVASRGEYVCLLNPDTVVHPGAFRELIAFLDAHPKAGCVGPRVLNKDGSFQLSAKRSIPTPFDSVSRALLLSKIFPKSETFARYNMTYLDPDTTHAVDASTGCCMVMRRKALDEVGLLDEGYFLYCEDVDWFLRAKKAGWEVWYVASATIEHHHAYSKRFRKQKAVKDFHDSMVRFHEKHFAESYPAAVNQLIYAAVRTRMHGIVLVSNLRGWQ